MDSKAKRARGRGTLLLMALAALTGAVMTLSGNAVASAELSGDSSTHPWYSTEYLEMLHGQGNTERMVIVVEEKDGDVWYYENYPDRWGTSMYRAMN